MGRVKKILCELDNGAEAVVTEWGLTLGSDALEGSYHITVNDLEGIGQMLRYLREVKPLQTLKDITGSHPHLDASELATMPALTIPPPLEAPAEKRNRTVGDLKK